MSTPPPSYTTTFTVDRPAQAVFDAILDVRGWWSEDVVGVTDEVGSEFRHHYQDVHRCTVRVSDLVPGRKVSWLVLDNFFSFVEDQSEWQGTEIVFDLAETLAGTEVRFTHVGLAPQLECYDVCSDAWAGYIHRSLPDLITTGRGHPNPRDEGPAPSHQEAATLARSQRG